MILQAEVSLYPLRSPNLSRPILDFGKALRGYGLHPQTGNMSTTLSGESKDVFDALRCALETVGARHEVVLVVKVSNACPGATECRIQDRPPA